MTNMQFYLRRNSAAAMASVYAERVNVLQHQMEAMEAHTVKTVL